MAAEADRHRSRIWTDIADDDTVPLSQASLRLKSSVILRTGLLMLSSGTGANRVREVMDKVGGLLDVSCRADVDLVHIDITVTNGCDSYTEVASLPTTGVNTHRMQLVNSFVASLARYGSNISTRQAHSMLDEMEAAPQNYRPWMHGLASGAACGAFVYLLGGGLVEMFCAALGAGFGHFARRKFGTHHLNHFFSMMLSVVVAALIYLLALHLVDLLLPGIEASDHKAGYIGALLFVIPGFPLITGGLDIARFNFASGIERLCYAFTIIALACFTGWLVARAVSFYPSDFTADPLAPWLTCLLRMFMSFVGVFGFSMMFNSTPTMCCAAALMGMLSNTLRLELVDLAALPPELAALLGALCSGLLASVLGLKLSVPRISLTVPSVVIMVPGLYLYRAMYFLGEFNTVEGLSWGMRAVIIMLCLPMGLALARVLTDPAWRYD